MNGALAWKRAILLIVPRSIMARPGGNPLLEKYRFPLPEGRLKPFDKRLTISVTEDIKEELREHLGKGVNEYCRQAIFEMMRRDGMKVEI